MFSTTASSLDAFSPASVSKVFRLLLASLPAPTMSSSEMSNSLTPLSFRRGVRAGVMGVRLLGGLNMLGAVGLRKGALGIPLRGVVVSIFLTSPLPLAWKGTPAVFFSCWAVSVDFCNSSALRVALLGFLFSWKCFTGGVRGPTRVVNALLLRYWHSSGSMVDASHSLTFSRSSPRISCTFGFCSSKSRLREPVSGKDFRMSATISTQGSESTVASWMISDKASFISSTVRLGRCNIPSSSLSFTGGDKLEKHSRMLSITDTVRREAMLGGVHSSSVEPSLL